MTRPVRIEHGGLLQKPVDCDALLAAVRSTVTAP